MTGRDIMPFGKYAKEKVALEDVPDDYIDWLMEQDWFTDPKGRWRGVYAYFKARLSGDEEAEETLSTPKERSNINIEHELLKDASPSFITFWKRSYGERLRKDGEILYIAHLRVALAAYNAGVHDQTVLLRDSGPPPRRTPEVAQPIPPVPPITGDEPLSEKEEEILF